MPSILFGLTNDTIFITIPMIFILLEILMTSVIFIIKKTVPDDYTLFVYIMVFIVYTIPILNVIMFATNVYNFILFIRKKL